MEQICVRYIPPREVKDTILGGLHHTNIRAGASLLVHLPSWHKIIVLYNILWSVQLCVKTTHRHVTNICQLHTTQEVHA